MSRKWNLKRLFRGHKEWLSNPDSKKLFYDRSRKEVEEAVGKEPTPADLRVFARTLERFAVWEAVYGAVLVSEGNQVGWSHIGASVEYDGWRLRLQVGLCERDQGAPVFVGDACRCLAAAIALRRDALAHWCGLRLVKSVETGDEVFLGWQHTPFEPFLVKLYALWRGQNLDVRRPGICRLGVYQQVFDAWDDEPAFAAAVRGICDYHCARTTGSRLDHEFQWGIYDVFPGEVLALQRIRRELGMPQVTVEHPLLDNPLAHPPEEIVPVEDELMERGIGWLRRVMGWGEDL